MAQHVHVNIAGEWSNHRQRKRVSKLRLFCGL